MSAFSPYVKDVALGICIFLAPFLIPAFAVSTDVGTLVTATSAVFAIVAGFFIADAMSNYLRLQTLISEENAALISIADYAKRIDSENWPAVHDAIDVYIIAQLDSHTLNHIIETEERVDAINTTVNTLKIDPEDSESYQRLLEMKERILTSRQEILFAAKQNLTIGHWATLITLGALVALTVLAIRDGSIFMNVVAGSMMVGMYAILVLLRDMDNNRLLEMKLGYDNPSRSFSCIINSALLPAFFTAGGTSAR
ncbi:MAG: hypothetical protein Q8R25_01365 [bacterium]|nr:hypothetical protein [bacterium]